MRYGLGVDLGTTYSAAAVAAGGRIEVLTLGSRAPVMPSVLVLRDHGEVLTGEAAERRAVTEPGRTARAFKRRLGDPTPLFLGGVPYGAETLTAHLLRAIVAQVSEQQGAPPEALALTHPATWGEYKLDLLRLAVQQADVGDALLVPEPVAAAVHDAFRERVEVGQLLAVYDFGGGTFDLAIVRRTPDGFVVVGEPSGLDRLGGVDVDEAVLHHVDQSLGGALRALDPGDPEVAGALARLRTECQLAKEALSDDTDTTIPVAVPTLSTEVRLTRAELEAMLRPRLGETIEVLERVARSAGVGVQDLSRVLLVGGTSRIPLVRQFVREQVGLPVAVDAHPKYAVALGAAALAGRALSASPPAPTTAAVGPPVAASGRGDGVREVAPPPGDAPSGGRSRRGLVAVLVAVLLAAVVAAVVLLGGGDGDETVAATTISEPGPGSTITATSAPPTTGTAPPTSAAASPTSGPESVTAAGLDLPRTARFGGVTFRVEAVEVDEGDAARGPSLTARATATSAYTRATVYLTPMVPELVVGGEERRGSIAAGGVVPPGESVAVEVVFDLPVGAAVPDLAGAVLRFSNDGDEPLELPLAGEPVAPDADPSFVPPAPVAVPAANLVLDLTAGSVSRDLPVDPGGSVDTTTTRAGAGSGFVWLQGTATATCATGCGGGVLASSGIARLVVDGNVLPPTHLTFNEVLVEGQQLEVDLVFEVPLGAAAYVLRFEVGSGEAVDVPLVLPELDDG